MNKFVLFCYGILTIIKLFTAKVLLVGDSLSQLVIKIYPTTSNTFEVLGGETIANIEKYKDTWYYKGNYITLLSDEYRFLGESIYLKSMSVWWVLTLILLIFYLHKLLTKKGLSLKPRM
ncbi:hypothetical protein [Sporosalibacterium faouarense]|uniref:hypothetical protein n=1 Tax=Sporosalibacterium faouarense TaxID=516123 RepID=UPI00141CB4C8|nr:hypothetical protein [Sporosalibacterium faouarense]MTI46742.1 hypothetical protein [Bacillota bacterium]